MTHWRIRRLNHSDSAEFRRLRLEALRLHPEAFAASYEEAAQLDPEELARRFLSPPSCVFGGFADSGALVGIVALMGSTLPKLRHKASLVSVYVAAHQRNTGLGRALLVAAITYARETGLSIVQLHVTAGNEAAYHLYEDLGFRLFGVEPRSLCVNDVFYDTHMMVLDLDRD